MISDFNTNTEPNPTSYKLLVWLKDIWYMRPEDLIILLPPTLESLCVSVEKITSLWATSFPETIKYIQVLNVKRNTEAAKELVNVLKLRFPDSASMTDLDGIIWFKNDGINFNRRVKPLLSPELMAYLKADSITESTIHNSIFRLERLFANFYGK